MQELLDKFRHSENTTHLVAFWQRLPRPEGELCPRRTDFMSSQINGAIAETFMSEWDGPDTLRVIQAGTVLDRLIGLDMTDKNIFELTPPELVDDEKRYYNALRTRPCAGMITRSMINFAGKPFVYRTIQLPLLDPYGNVKYFVGTGIVFEGKALEAEFSRRSFRRTRLVERHFFDIGAGVPSTDEVGPLGQGGPLHRPFANDP
ncbi:MAG: PAS domain-containing protein [Alphaproteobacteria bacterium]|nr:PAS domain-containing protein [Alphaproteobacteria bacterium]